MIFSDQSIRRDFDKFIEYLNQPKGIELTKDRGNMRTADLLALNERMHHRLEIFNPKAKQMSFSVLNTFFYIARTAQLFLVKKDVAGRKCWLEIQKDRVRQYDALTDDEQYFFLLETFWCFMDWDEAFDSRSFSDGEFYLELCQQPVGKSVSIGDRDLKRAGKIEAPMELFAAEVFAAFGFFDLVWDEKLTTRPNRYAFPYQSATLSEIGKIMLLVLLKNRSRWIWGEQNSFLTADLKAKLEQYFEEAEKEKDDFGFGFGSRPPLDNSLKIDESELEQPDAETFASAFEAVLPGLKIEKGLFPIDRDFVQGSLTLKILLTEKCYREIAISSEASLEDLHNAIQRLFKFDDDHLYAFFMSGQENYRAGEVYCDPRGNATDGQIPAYIVRLGELGLYLGKEFLYIFDFGDNWQFQIRVLGIEPGGKVSGKFQVLKTEGKAPKQYRSWEGDDD